MSENKKHYTGGESSIWIQPSGPGTQIYFLGCHSIEGIDEPLGDYNPFFCPDPSKPNAWIKSGGTIQPADAVETQIESDVTDQLSLLETLKCPFSLYINQFPCGRRDVFANYDRTFALDVRKVGSRQYNSVALREANDRTVMTHNLLAAPPLVKIVSVSAMKQIVPMSSSGLGVTVATNAGGVYQTLDFYSDPAIWYDINDGLDGNTDCRCFSADAVNGFEDQYVLSESNRTIYGRRGGNWSSILTSNEAQIEVGAGGGALYWVQAGDDSAGKVCALFCTLTEGLFPADGQVYILWSDDYGVSWDSELVVDSFLRSVRQCARHNDILIATYQTGRVTRSTLLWRTDNLGTSSIESPRLNAGAGTWSTNANIDPYDTSKIIVQSGQATERYISRLDGTVSSGLGLTLLDTISVFRPDAVVWRDDGEYFVLSGLNLYFTDDDGASFNIVGTFVTNKEALDINPSDATKFAIGEISPSDTSPETVFEFTIGDANLTPNSGPSPGVAPYTNSIPYTAGGVCLNAISFDTYTL